jgi:NADH dehydrogenase
MLGGTGFVGRSIASKLAAQGHEVRVLTRRRERNRDMLVLPTLTLAEGDVSELGFLREHFQNIDVIINLIGILNPSGRNNFQRIHVDLVNKIIEAMQQTGVRRLLHMSALNASKEGPSKYLRTKAEAEEQLYQSSASDGFEVTTFRPSVIFGPSDGFINRFADLLRIAPKVLPLACPNARFQPVYVEDVAACFVKALHHHDTFGQRYDLCGPQSYTLFELVTYIADLIHVRCRIVQLSDWQSRLQAGVMQWLPGKPFTLDNYNSMKVDSVCDGQFPEVFDVTPQPLEAIVPGYLHERPEHLDLFRRLARR